MNKGHHIEISSFVKQVWYRHSVGLPRYVICMCFSMYSAELKTQKSYLSSGLFYKERVMYKVLYPVVIREL